MYLMSWVVSESYMRQIDIAGVLLKLVVSAVLAVIGEPLAI